MHVGDDRLALDAGRGFRRVDHGDGTEHAARVVAVPVGEVNVLDLIIRG